MSGISVLMENLEGPLCPFHRVRTSEKTLPLRNGPSLDTKHSSAWIWADRAGTWSEVTLCWEEVLAEAVTSRLV